ncbi:MAG: DsbA family protein [Candidatus Paceibacterota bacterium]
MAQEKSRSQNYFFYFLVILFAGVLFYYGFKNSNNLSPVNQSKAVEKALAFINNNLIEKPQKAEVKKIEQESGVYKVTLKIENNEVPVYVSKDGNLLFLQTIDLKEAEKTVNTNTNEIKTCEEIKKSNSPKLEAFVVSQCPFGLQMQRILNEVIKSLPSFEKYIVVKYIGEIENGKITAMHGDEEAQENLRQICIREEQSDKYWPYIDCYIQEGKTENCLKIAKIDQEKLNACVRDNSRGLSYAQKDFEKAEKFNIGGSPTLLINDQLVNEFNFGGRTAEVIKTILCCGLESQPSECQKTLNQDQAATGFSKTYSSENSASGSCQ